MSRRLLNVSELPRYRPVARVGSFSSYDRTGGNDDGFSGEYSFLRKQADGSLVIAELQGPGALTRVWTPESRQDTIAFFFDGEAAPRLRLPMDDLFTGKVPPFLAPMSGSGAGGYYAYTPLEFASSIKVVVKSKQFTFYQINYVQYRPGTAVRSFRPGDRFEAPEPVLEGRMVPTRGDLAPGKTLNLFRADGPGRIVELRLRPADGLTGPMRDILLRAYWDGEKRPAIEVPVGDLFGYYFGEPAARSLLVGTDYNWNYLRFPMPFLKGARIDLVSQSACGPSIPILAEITVSDRGRQAEEGAFHATWRREDPVPPGMPFRFLDVQGKGHLVGAILQAQGAYPGQKTEFFEGDDVAIVDGDTTIRGTGSEDFFNGGWYEVPGRWDGRYSLPFSGSLGYQKDLARTGGYRLLLGDAYGFHRSLTLTIEHGGENNSHPTDYTGVTYFYLDRAGGTQPPLPEPGARAVNSLVTGYRGVHATCGDR